MCTEGWVMICGLLVFIGMAVRYSIKEIFQ